MKTKIFTLFLLVFSFLVPSFSSAQSPCPANYHLHGQVCCHNTLEKDSVIGLNDACQKIGVIPPEKLCQRRSDSLGIWCNGQDACGYASYLGGFYRFDICLTPPPAQNATYGGELYDYNDNSFNLYCDSTREEIGPRGAEYNAFYCQPKQVNGVIVPMVPPRIPEPRTSCISGIPGSNGDGENWCCPAGQVAMTQLLPRGTPYCAVLPAQITWSAPPSGGVTGLTTLGVKLLSKADVNIYLKKKGESDGAFVRIKSFSFADGSLLNEYGAQAGQVEASVKPAYQLRAYRWDWDTKTVVNGEYVLRAEAMDGLSQRISSDLDVTVSNLGVVLTAPAHNTTVKGAIPVWAETTGLVSKLQFLLNYRETGVVPSQVGSNSYNLTWHAPNGSYVLSFKATGPSGEVAYSNTASVIVHNDEVNPSGQSLGLWEVVLNALIDLLLNSQGRPIGSATSQSTAQTATGPLVSGDQTPPTASVHSVPAIFNKDTGRVTMVAEASDPSGVGKITFTAGMATKTCAGSSQTTRLTCSLVALSVDLDKFLDSQTAAGFYSVTDTRGNNTRHQYYIVSVGDSAGVGTGRSSVPGSALAEHPAVVPPLLSLYWGGDENQTNYNIQQGETVWFHWRGDYVTSCRMTSTPPGAWTGGNPLAITGDYGLRIPDLGEYTLTLTCTNDAGTAVSRTLGLKIGTVPVTAQPPVSPPVSSPTTRLTVNLPRGGEVWRIGEIQEINWSDSNYNPASGVQYKVYAATFDGSWYGEINYTGDLSLNWSVGRVKVNGQERLLSPGNYWIQIIKQDGQIRPDGSAINQVISAGSVELVSSPTPTLSLAVTPSTATVGANPVVSWSTTNATTCTASGAWTGSRATTGTYLPMGLTNNTYVFTLTCQNSIGASVTKSVTLVMNAPTAMVHEAFSAWLRNLFPNL